MWFVRIWEIMANTAKKSRWIIFSNDTWKNAWKQNKLRCKIIIIQANISSLKVLVVPWVCCTLSTFYKNRFFMLIASVHGTRSLRGVIPVILHNLWDDRQKVNSHLKYCMIWTIKQCKMTRETFYSVQIGYCVYCFRFTILTYGHKMTEQDLATQDDKLYICNALRVL